MKKTNAHTSIQRYISTLLIFAFIFSFTSPAHALFDFSIKDEVELGKKFNILVRSQLPLVQDPEVTGYINEIVQKIAKAAPPQPFPFTSGVISNNAVNAFATPGGYLFVYTGLILALEHESELASVIAHEMAHITQRHIASRIAKGRFVGILSVVGALAGVFLGGDIGSGLASASLAGGQSAMLGYSRTDEGEADQVGLGYLIKAGYAPKGMANAFKILSKKQWNLGDKIPEYYLTHPHLSTRVNDMNARVALLPAEIQNRKENDNRFYRIQTLVRAQYSSPDLAEISFKKILNKGDDPLAYMGQGILNARLNKVGEAKKSFAKALSLSPNDPLILREAGYFEYTKGNPVLGEELLKKALHETKNKDIMASFYYAKVLEGQNKLDEAIQEVKKVLKAVPEDVEVHDTLVRLYGYNKEDFYAYLHMAYSALYSNHKAKTRSLAEKVSQMARSPEEKKLSEQFEKQYNARKEFW